MMNQWSFEEEEQFQAALLCYPEDYPNRWENIAQVVGFSREMVFQRYQNLQIELGLVQLSQYLDSSANNQPPKYNRRSSWTLEEHTLFLLGVKKYGWGHWKNVSKYAVMTRDASQVASHAQKFYIRQKERETREHARGNIHDITLANSNPGHLNHLLSSRPHLVPHSRSIMQQSHQAALPIRHDIQLNQLSTQMNQNPHYQPNSQVVDQSLPWNQGDQSEIPHYQPNPQVGDQSLPWNQGDQFENSHYQPNSQVVDQSLPGNPGDQFESESLYEEVAVAAEEDEDEDEGYESRSLRNTSHQEKKQKDGPDVLNDPSKQGVKK
ncbi:hypothetical protein K1719_004584 [Acacia pycnantha]|nr:hypothetical protein K1719_004584 [Acacia pycnantha]